VRDPAAILAGAAAPPAAASAPRAAAGPLAAASAPDPYVYFLQVGAYSRPEDAEQQRARLAMLGHTAKVTEREQSGRVVYRVRLGPFEQRDEADAGKAKLGADGVEAALVRVSR
jgi:cell division protein FtsN